MLVNPREHLVRARREGWALGGFNVFDLESARAVIDAAERPALAPTRSRRRCSCRRPRAR
jgi:fructose/tagatose bisphosphate aldolase